MVEGDEFVITDDHAVKINRRKHVGVEYEGFEL